MAAPTEPASVTFVDTAKTDHHLQGGRAGDSTKRAGFVDDQGTWVLFTREDSDTTYDFRVYYSTDDGDTWTEEASNPHSMLQIETNFHAFWADPATGYVVFAGEYGTDDTAAEVWLWDSANKTLASKTNVAFDADSDGVQAITAIIGGWDTTDTDLLYILLTNIDDVNFFFTTLEYDKGVNTLTDKGGDALVSPDRYSGSLCYKHAEGTNPSLIDDPLSGVVVYSAMRDVNGDIKLQNFDWDSGLGRFDAISGSTTISATQVWEPVRMFYHPGQDRFYLVGAERGDPWECVVYKSDSNNPMTATWSEVGDYNLDVGSLPVDGGSTIRNVFDAVLIGDTIYMGMTHKTASDWDWRIIEYDVVADNWTETDAGFTHAEFYDLSQNPESGGFFHQYGGDGSEQAIYAAGFNGANPETDQHYVFVWPYALNLGGGGGAGLGWGFIPIGIA